MTEETNPGAAPAGAGTVPAVSGIVKTFLAVVTGPSEFFAQMPRTGGYAEPLVFMVAMGVAAGLVRALLGMFGLIHGLSFLMAFAAIFIAPILIVIFGFVGAALLFVVWKLMGSERDFETAYRCTAYAGGISPVAQLLMVIPYLGIVLALAWWALILVLASTQVHQIRQATAATVFGAIAALLAVMGLGAQFAAHRMETVLTNAQHQMQLRGDGAQSAGKAMQDLGNALEKMNHSRQGQ
ncbi:MAG: YIP1 family protein [Gammaproteobacteria bacterium]